MIFASSDTHTFISTSYDCYTITLILNKINKFIYLFIIIIIIKKNIIKNSRVEMKVCGYV